jgi:hypothetical protein
MESVIFYVRNGVEKTAIIRSRRVPNILSVKFAVISAELGQDPSPPSLKGASTLSDILESLAIVITDVRPRLQRLRRTTQGSIPPSEDPVT